VLTVAPPLGLCIFFYLQDRLEPEPHANVLAAFAIGLLAVAPALLTAQWLDRRFPTLGSTPFGDAYILAGGVEEGTKLVLFLLGIYWWDELDEPYDGIVYATALSLGFATTENVLFVLRGGLPVAALRALFSVPGHGLVGAIMGAHAGRARFARSAGGAVRQLVTGFLLAAAIHGTLDYVLTVSAGWRALGLAAVVSALAWVLVLRRMRRAQELSPFRSPGGGNLLS
jgi:RsiW-degrading membrane proteinase PrsW (M82 family)